jgi:CHAT domain-containing protein/tetratricopeptide (TPR) repeat protein
MHPLSPSSWRPAPGLGLGTGRLPGAAAVLAVTLAAGAAAGLASEEGAEPPRPLPPGEPRQGELSAGARHLWSAEAAAGRPWLLTVEQGGIDVTVDVTGPGGGVQIAADSPWDRRGVETVLVEPAGSGAVHLPLDITLEAREPGAPPGTYTILLQDLSGAGEARLAAERAMTEAAQRYREGTAEAWRQGAEAYRRARHSFAESGDRRGEARALYGEAVLLRLVDEAAEALAAAREAAGLFAELGEGFWAAAGWNEVGLDRWALGETAPAREAFAAALAGYRAVGERYGEGSALANLCLMDLVAGELRTGAACYEEALPILAEVQAAELEAAARTSAGRAWDVLGEPGKARQSYRRALAVMESTGNRRGQAQVLNNLAVLTQETGGVEEALELFDRALEIFRALGEARWEARVLGNLGYAYAELGEPRRARVWLEQALAGWREVGDARGEIQTLSNLGRVEARLGDLAASLELQAQALERARGLEDRRAEGIALAELARVTAEAGSPETAVGLYGQALERLAAVEDRRGEIAALRRRGELRTDRGETAAALEDLERALGLARASGDRAGEAEALWAAAVAERRAGRPAAARERLEAALAIIESLRIRIANPDLRAAYAAMQPRAYELRIDLAMEAHRADPGAGHDREALELGERARARSLVELLEETRTELFAGVDPELAARRKDLLDSLSAKAERALRAPPAGEAEAAVREAERAELLRRLDLVEAEIRRRHPGREDLSRPSPLSTAEIQGLLDPDTLLLVYSLGEERGFLWALTRTAVKSFELPGRPAVEAAVRDGHRRFARYDPAARAEDAGAAAQLSRMLLGPVREFLGELGGERRLVIVPDGALHYLPWGALPLPEEGGSLSSAPPRPVLARHPVVVLPSASVLASLRRLEQNREPAPRRIALVADPVFGSDDPRLAAAADSSVASAPSPPPAAGERGGLARLPWTRSEAEAIAALVPPDERLLALGFAASRAAVEGGALAGYRVVHFATHGILDAENPALSGLVLSLVDAEGRRQPGFLQLSDIYNLHLGADLVVLSGCRTALGREIRGEGLVGLVRGFLHAGAPRVVASLWRVEDRATAELMRRFYRALWEEGLAPAAALRSAQLSVAGERRWRDPYFWAGFELIGDWR